MPSMSSYKRAMLFAMGLGLLGLAPGVTEARAAEQSNIQQPIFGTACDQLCTNFVGQVARPGDKNFTVPYWSAQQSELTPSCRFFPKTAKQIQAALADILIPNNVSIAVSSGGYSSNIGASNVQHGVTIDMKYMNEINYFLDAGEAVYLGPGNRWSDIYSVMDGSNLTVAGARAASVGVGGFVLGGGLSWFTSQAGWAMDNVIELQVITPTAEILKIQPHQHEDLFWAMKGSLGAFGIVTSIKMKTLPANGVYGGTLTYGQKSMPQLCSALENLVTQLSSDVNATQGYLSFGWIEAKNDFTYSAYLLNTAGRDYDKVFTSFKVVQHSGNTLRQMTIGESAKEIDQSNPLGLRRSKFTMSSQASAKAMMALHEVVKTFVSKIDQFDKDSTLGVTFQPLVMPSKPQPSMFNIGPAQGPLLVISVEFWWSSPGKDSYFDTTARELRTSMEAALKRLNMLQNFVYPNYAAKDQNPLDALTPLSCRMLTATQRKYDPGNLWRDMVPGIWHI